MYLTPGDQAYLTKLKMDLESLTEFEKDVRAALEELLADTKKMTEYGGIGVKWADYGTGFNEAYVIGLRAGFAAEDIRSLLKMLHQQMEAMALSIKMAGDQTFAADEQQRKTLSKLLYGTENGGKPYNVDPPAETPPVDGSPGTGEFQEG